MSSHQEEKSENRPNAFKEQAHLCANYPMGSGKGDSDWRGLNKHEATTQTSKGQRTSGHIYRPELTRCVYQFQRDRSIKDFRSQPFTFTFTDEDKRERKYTPDFIVWRSDNSIEIHEVTVAERRERSQSREREQAAQKICQEKRWKYIVHTEQTLPQETEVANLLALLPYRLMRYAHEGVGEAVRMHLSSTPCASLSDCSKSISRRLDLSEATVFRALCHLLWRGEIAADLRSLLLIIDCSFNPAVKIWLPNMGEKEQ